MAAANDPYNIRPPEGRATGPTLDRLIANATRLSGSELAAAVVGDLRDRWARGERLPVESYLDQLPGLRGDRDGLLDVIYGEILAREEQGEAPQLGEYLERFPAHESDLRRQFNLHNAVKSQLRSRETPQTGATETRLLSTSAPRLPWSSGTDLEGMFGRYRIDRLLGRGGMGAVYLAHDTQLERPVALKVMRFATDDSPYARERFQREARAAATLSHPNICPVYDVGTIDNIPYLTMAYLPGVSLAELCKAGQRLPQHDVAALVHKLALALAEAHQRGIVHRDVKPSNVILNQRREPVLMDFGLARQAKPGDERLTSTGQMIGTPSYMSPEQVAGDVRSMGPGCDIYSLGVVLYELLTGHTPFQGTVAQILSQVLNDEPPKPSVHRPDIDPRLEAICCRAMAKSIADRYADMNAFAAALEDYLQQTQPAAGTSAARPQGIGSALGASSGVLPSTVGIAKVSAAQHVAGRATVPAQPVAGRATVPAQPVAGRATVPASQPAAALTKVPASSRQRSRRWRWAAAAVVAGLGGGIVAAFSLLGPGNQNDPSLPPAPLAAGPTTSQPATTGRATPDTSPQVVRADQQLANRARAILEANCYRCHGKDDAAEGGFKDVLDVRRMIARKKLVPGKAADSKIFKKIVAGDMPPENEKPRPDQKDIDLLAQWIDAGAPDWQTEALVKERPWRTSKDVLAAMRDHLSKKPADERRWQRYFTLTHLHNNPAVKETDLRAARAALSKAVNSLSWKNTIVLPEGVDAEQTVLAIDIRKLDWDRHNRWNEILKLYPYGLKYDRAADESVRDLARDVYEMADTDLPCVRADWFVATALRPPLYHTLLRLPKYAGDLEKQLKVDVRHDFLKDKLTRAGFASSGISGQNRLVERHESPYGAYWKSYDFKSNEGEGNLFRYPLGPQFAGNPHDRQAFKHDGGEIIFNLPNGLQGYLLVNGKDERIDEGPIEVVSDSLKTSGSAKVVNGLSCAACHSQGMKVDFKDTVRDGTAVLGEPLLKVRRLYVEPAAMKKLLDQDSDRFLTALDKTMGPFLKVEEDKGKDIKDFTEPCGSLARQYILKELTLVDAALELGVDDPTELYRAIKLNDRLRELGLRPLVNRATIKRETWESLERYLALPGGGQ